MTISTKTTIKTFFQTGDFPTQQNFSDFIDSTLFLAETSSQTVQNSLVIGGNVTVSGSSTFNTFTSFIPSTYPTQGGILLNTPVSAPQLAFMNTNSIWNADILGVTSNDPVTQGGTATVGGTITVGDQVGLQFVWAANNITVKYTVIGGDTTLTIASKLTNLIKANTTISAVFWTNYLIGTSIIQVQPYSTITPTVTAFLSGGATESMTVTSLSTDLDTNPIIFINHYVPGRADQIGDAIGAINFGSLTNPDQAGGIGISYVNLLAEIASPSTPLGQFYINTVDSTGLFARFLIQRGLVGFDQNQVQATGGDKGQGTINLPGGYFLGGVDIRAVFNTNIGAVSGAVLTAAQMYNGIINRTTQATATDTTDTATNILATIPNPSLGTSYEILLINDMGGTWTINGGSGVTIGTSTGALSIATAQPGRRVWVQVTGIGTPAIVVWG